MPKATLAHPGKEYHTYRYPGFRCSPPSACPRPPSPAHTAARPRHAAQRPPRAAPRNGGPALQPRLLPPSPAPSSRQQGEDDPPPCEQRSGAGIEQERLRRAPTAPPHMAAMAAPQRGRAGRAQGGACGAHKGPRAGRYGLLLRSGRGGYRYWWAGWIRDSRLPFPGWAAGPLRAARGVSVPARPLRHPPCRVIASLLLGLGAYPQEPLTGLRPLFPGRSHGASPDVSRRSLVEVMTLSPSERQC